MEANTSLQSLAAANGEDDIPITATVSEFKRKPGVANVGGAILPTREGRGNAVMPPARDKDARLRAVPVSELLSYEFPERQMLLGPWLPDRSLAMVYGARGVGKSFLTLSVALAVAGGTSFLGWRAPSPQSVLYIDGEMPGDALQTRVRALAGELPSEYPLRFVARDLLPRPIPPLNKESTRGFIDELAKQHHARLIILDNLSTLWRGDENDAQAWSDMQEWLIAARSEGRSVLLVHHAGKSGSQRGTSRREDALDVVLGLRKPDTCGTGSCAAFNVNFEKSRSVYGSDLRPFFAKLDSSSGAGLEAWARASVRIDGQLERMVALRSQGRSNTEIADLLGINKSTVGRTFKRADANNELAPGWETRDWVEEAE